MIVCFTGHSHITSKDRIKEFVKEQIRIIAPNKEDTPLKFAISKRNEWMILNSDIVIAYVDHEYGGAYKALQIARRKNKQIINIPDIISSRLRANK